MRLLNCRTKFLEEFVGDKITPRRYAILSHTWEKEEVVFSDITEGNADYTRKKGWYKIDKSCRQALKDGLDYIWADTVCIDKSSSAELSEAINSMFKWYQRASICYAYLCDLPEVPFHESRWFTRGWTLQEMIAPERLHFYDRDWDFRGSKLELLDTLHDITGVDTTALRGGNLRFFSVARKMSWASRRSTLQRRRHGVLLARNLQHIDAAAVRRGLQGLHPPPGRDHQGVRGRDNIRMDEHRLGPHIRPVSPVARGVCVGREYRAVSYPRPTW